MEKKIKLIEENGENNDMKIFGNTMDGETVTYTIGWYCESIEKCKEEILGYANFGKIILNYFQRWTSIRII